MLPLPCTWYIYAWYVWACHPHPGSFLENQVLIVVVCLRSMGAINEWVFIIMAQSTKSVSRPWYNNGFQTRLLPVLRLLLLLLLLLWLLLLLLFVAQKKDLFLISLGSIWVLPHQALPAEKRTGWRMGGDWWCDALRDGIIILLRVLSCLFAFPTISMQHYDELQQSNEWLLINVPSRRW